MTKIIERTFSAEGINPFDRVKWEKRTAEITDDRGKVVFKQKIAGTRPSF